MVQGKYAQIVMGPAGSGKSTYCSAMERHFASSDRSVHIVNLDPAAESFDYNVSIDIRDLISLQDVLSELDYGPNGGLIYCMEYLMENLDWLGDQLNDFSEDYLIFDCPGQIELYTHLPIMQIIIKYLQKLNYQCCAVYLLDCMFISDSSRFISGSLMCLSAMIQLELPHINVLTKCDQLEKNKREELLEKFLDPTTEALLLDLNAEIGEKYSQLNTAISTLLEQYSMVSFLALDITDEDSVNHILANIDGAIQYGEDAEVKEPKDEQQIQELNALNFDE